MTAPTPPETLPTVEEGQRLMTAALIAGLLAAGVALLLFTWLGREVLEGDALRLDSHLREVAQAAASPTLTEVMVAASFYGGPVILIPAALVGAFAFLVHGWNRGALLAVLTVAGAALLNWLLKKQTKRRKFLASKVISIFAVQTKLKSQLKLQKPKKAKLPLRMALVLQPLLLTKF
jgi:hypothetical protein